MIDSLPESTTRAADSRESDARSRELLLAWAAVFAMTALGALAGALAQTLRGQYSNAESALGGATAIWVTLGYLAVRLFAARWRYRDRLAWTCVLSACYLFAWLTVYHLLFGLHWSLSSAQVWSQARYWTAAVAPACLVLGSVAVYSLRRGVLGDICLALPLGWSLPEVVARAGSGAAYLEIISVPTLLVAIVPLLGRRKRRWSVLTVALTVVAAGIATYGLLDVVRQQHFSL